MSILGVVVAHGVILALFLFVVPAGRVAEFVQPLAVRLIELVPEALPPPAPTRPQPQRKPPPQQTRILAVTPVSNAPEASLAFVVPTPPPEPAVPPAPTFVAIPAPLTAARFDAAYLQNPRPVYPAISRRLGEEGKVVLRVLVDAAGLATEVTIKNSSGFPRLDNAARDVVQQWRFVPARWGDEAIDARVLVPIVFKLEG